MKKWCYQIYGRLNDSMILEAKIRGNEGEGLKILNKWMNPE